MSKTMVPIDLSDAQRWSIVRRRDSAAKPTFVYAVKTTGVYCRPGCSSRLPRRENVAFFASGLQARAAGYRACKRCRPDEAAPQDRQTAAALAACALLDGSHEPVRLEELAAETGYSPAHLQRVFKRIVGVSPRAYAAMRRVERSRAKLASGASAATAAYAAGYGSSSRFYDEAAETMGMTPAEFKNGAAGRVIRAAVADCYLGFVLAAATDKGICAIDLDDEPRALWRRLRERFSKARIVDNDDSFNQSMSEVVALIEAPQWGLSLPLDVQGTAYQRRVWEALMKTPAGSTTTYAELAARIGRPNSVRAVAGACAANKLAVAVPCHRVLRSDGAISGYRWGVARKQKLLARERGAG